MPGDLCVRDSGGPRVRHHDRVLVELLPPDTSRAFLAMGELRPGLTEGEFVARADAQRAAGYRLVAAVDDDRGPALAVAGFRLAENLAWGRHLYVDDLSTRAVARGQGRGRSLLDWLEAEARRVGAGQIHLDSGVGPDRLAAHRLYLNAGFRISSHHFAREVPARR